MIIDKLGYKRERTYILEKFGVYVRHTCYVAHVKSTLGISRGHSANRIDPNAQTNPCPTGLWAMVEEAVRHVHTKAFCISN